VGESFDPRIAQANERTLLAWVRTALGLIAFGFVVARAGVWMRQLAGDDAPADNRFGWVGVAFIGLGTLFSVLATLEFARVRRAIEENRPMKIGRLAPMLTVLVALLGAGLVIILLTQPPG
jgi:putative membrane protein